MKNYTIELIATYKIEFIERLLRLLRHRQMHVESLNYEKTQNEKIQLIFNINTLKNKEQVEAYLQKLYDINTFTVNLK